MNGDAAVEVVVQRRVFDVTALTVVALHVKVDRVTLEFLQLPHPHELDIGNPGFGAVHHHQMPTETRRARGFLTANDDVTAQQRHLSSRLEGFAREALSLTEMHVFESAAKGRGVPLELGDRDLLGLAGVVIGAGNRHGIPDLPAAHILELQGVRANGSGLRQTRPRGHTSAVQIERARAHRADELLTHAQIVCAGLGSSQGDRGLLRERNLRRADLQAAIVNHDVTGRQLQIFLREFQRARNVDAFQRGRADIEHHHFARWDHDRLARHGDFAGWPRLRVAPSRVGHRVWRWWARRRDWRFCPRRVRADWRLVSRSTRGQQAQPNNHGHCTLHAATLGDRPTRGCELFALEPCEYQTRARDSSRSSHARRVARAHLV